MSVVLLETSQSDDDDFDTPSHPRQVFSVWFRMSNTEYIL